MECTTHFDSDFELVTYASGIKSLRSKVHHQTFHPATGPLIEATILHVEQQNLFSRAMSEKGLVVWDVGLGAAANTIAAIEALKTSPYPIEIHSFDQTLAALIFALKNAQALAYLEPYTQIIETLIQQKHVWIGPNLHWRLHLGDFRQTMHSSELVPPHCIFYDPYSPSVNMAMWNLEHFSQLFNRLDPKRATLLSNYTRSTAVRVTLLLAGFYVGIGKLIGEKEETTVASNHKELIPHLLPSTWLKRVQISHSSAPLQGENYQVLAISARDMLTLSQHPQWQS